MGEFLVFFEMFLKFLEQLMEKKNETEIRSHVLARGRHEFFAMTQFLRQEKGLKGWRLALERQKAWAQYIAMEDEQLCMMVSEAVERRSEQLAGDVAPDESEVPA